MLQLVIASVLDGLEFLVNIWELFGAVFVVMMVAFGIFTARAIVRTVWPDHVTCVPVL